MTAQPDTTVYILQDGVMPVEFAGRRIATISNEAPTRSRWTEVELFRTVARQFVVHVIARSVIFHDLNGCGTANGEEMDLDTAIEQDGEACGNCINNRSTTFKRVVMEGDRHQTRVFADMRALNTGINEFGGLGRQAVEQAVRNGDITAADLSTVRTVIP